ncbi:MAG: hypothetical protein A2Y97_04810 [Nitrospirae bacterium RBG_13_39_12]|nr:MAG: hypothetical protein A2Y97_04810 [Nitrospirae bacterium RBG_13_39_12]
MHKNRNYKITERLLEEYQKYSFENSSELLVEATLLLENKHYARAYFVGCASLEETGKGYTAFSSRGRNLRSPSVQKAIREKFEDHSSKIISSLICLLRQKELTEENIQHYIKLASHLQRGREKAMYVDVRENGTVSLPRTIVRPRAALDCVRLAQASLEATVNFVSDNPPDKFSSFQDKMLCLSTHKITKLTNSKDFWCYYIDLLSNNYSNVDFAKAVVKYHDELYCKGKLFLKKK